jgi:dolichyl-phosphate beta-glucosyltransferase
LTWLQEKQQKNAAYTYEIIVVDDGSRGTITLTTLQPIDYCSLAILLITDRTSDVALEWVKKNGTDRVRLLRLAKNQGKGGAVQQVTFRLTQ